MSARQVIEGEAKRWRYLDRRKDDAEMEESAKDFIKKLLKPLRLGKDWHLYISGTPHDDIPVELTHEKSGYFPNTLDAPYNLAHAVEAVLPKRGGSYDKARHNAAMDVYWNQIYADVSKGVLRGTANGVAGPRSWELYDDYEQPF
jgi:hypothetical protein